jgi:hypothetical protein
MNCKRVIGFFLALLILVSNVGFAFTMHYCGGKVASVSVQTPKRKVVVPKKKLKKTLVVKTKRFTLKRK